MSKNMVEENEMTGKTAVESGVEQETAPDAGNIGKPKKKRILKILFGILVAAVAVCVIAFAAYRVHLGKKQALSDELLQMTIAGAVSQVEVEQDVEGSVDDAEPDPTDRDIDFDLLRETNPDIYAWIYVPETNIDYPILQSGADKEEDYYLEHNLDYSSGYPGCIYTQKRNAKDFSDPNTVIYGHNMKNGSMFRTLHNFEDAAFFAENQYFYIYTEDGKLTYRIFAAYQSDNSLILNKYHDFEDRDVFADYLSDIMSQTGSNCNINRGVNVTADDKIVTLSTCIGNASYRYLVQGVLVE